MKWVLIGLGALLILAVSALALIPYLLDTPRIQAAIARSASQAVGRPVTFASVSFSLLPPPALRLTDLRVAEDPEFGAAPFLTVGGGRLAVRLWPLLRGRVEVTELTLVEPRVAFIQEPGGRWNVTSLGSRYGGTPPTVRGDGASPATGLLALISRVRVVGGTVTYEARARAPREIVPTALRLEGLSLTLSSARPGAAIEFEGEARVTPGDLQLKIVEGSLTPEVGRPLGESALKAHVEFEGRDAAPVVRAFLGPAPQLAGPVRGKLAISGILARLETRGEIELPRLTVTERRPNCAEPKTRSLTLEAVRLPLAYAPLRLTGRPVSARLASGTLTAALVVELGPGPMLRLSEISVKALPLAPLLVDYLCQGYAVTGPLDLTGELAARPGDFWRTLSGQGQLRIGAGRVVGPEALALLSGVVRVGGALASLLEADLPPTLFASSLEFDSITATYRIADGRITTHDFLYSSQRLKVGAAGEYGLADGRMNLDLALTTGRSQVRARVTGTAALPSIQVRVQRRVLEAGPERLRRLLRGLTWPTQ